MCTLYGFVSPAYCEHHYLKRAIHYLAVTCQRMDNDIDGKCKN